MTNRNVCTRERSLIAVVAGTKSEDLIGVLRQIDEEKRFAVKEVTLDLSDSMRKIVRSEFPKASRVIDRFHIQKLACDAVQELRIKHRWNAIQQANDESDSDTIACMTGGIAAYYGIPSWLVKYVTVEFLPQYILDVLDRFDKSCTERNY